MTVVMVTGTPRPAQRPSVCITRRQFPAPRKRSCSCSVAKSSEHSTLCRRLIATSPRVWMLAVLADAEIQRAHRKAVADAYDVREREPADHPVGSVAVGTLQVAFVGQ